MKKLVLIIGIISFLCMSSFAQIDYHSDASKDYWGPYMKELETTIKNNWTPSKRDSSKRVVITFTIDKDGKLLNKRITKSSGVPLADRAAMSAIEKTAPFRPLPEEFKGNSVTIEFTFDYNVLTKQSENVDRYSYPVYFNKR